MKRFSSILWLTLTSLPTALFAETKEVPYIEPAENVNVVAIERVLLRQDEMQELSHHLLTLAKRKHDKSPEQQRATAQLIYLAQKVNPFDKNASEIADRLSQSEFIDHSSNEDISKSKKRIHYFTSSLKENSAEPQGRLLSSYLRDATVIFRNDIEDAKEENNWRNIIPSPDEYAELQKPEEIIEETPKPPIPPENTNDNPPPSDETKYYISKLQVKTPVIFKRGFKTLVRGEERWDHVVRVEFQTAYFRASNDPVEKSSLQYNLEPIIHYRWHDDERLPADPYYDELNKELSSLIQTRYPKLQHKIVSVKLSDGRLSKRNKFSLTGPIGVMAEASIKNIPLREDVVICANVDAEGNLKTPRKFWEYMLAVMENENGGRLIIPAAAEKIVTEMLILEKPEMFTKWEIFTAKDLSEAVIAGAVSNKKIDQASELFQSVQKLTEKSTVKQLSVNKAVRDRLKEVYNLANNHLSAKAILIQGGGRRPVRFSEETTPHVVLDAVVDIHQTVHGFHDIYSISLKNLNQSLTESREEMEKLKDYMGSRDGKLYHETVDLIDDCESLIKSLIRAQEDWERRATLMKRAIPKLQKIQETSTDLLKRTTVAAGYPEPIL